MIKRSGWQTLTDSDRALLLESSVQFKNCTLSSLLLDRESPISVDWPDLTPLTIALRSDDDGSIAAKRLYFRHVRAIAKQLRAERTIEDDYLDTYACKVCSERLLGLQLALNLLEHGWSAERVGAIMSELDCPAETTISLKNPDVTEAYLRSRRPEETFQDCESVLRPLIRDADARHLQLVLRHARGCFSEVTVTRSLLELIVGQMRDLHESERGRAFVETLLPRLELELDEETTLEHLERVLARANFEDLEVFVKRGFRCKFNGARDVLACLFGNREPRVLELLGAVDLEKSRGSGARSPLHFAAEASASASIRWLLRRGADPNVRDERGFTPLNRALNYRVPDGPIADEESVKMLLIAGADPLVNYAPSGEFFGIDAYSCSREAGEVDSVICHLMAQLAVYEALGVSIEAPAADYQILQRHRRLNDGFYEKCRRQLRELKTHEFRESREGNFTMFALLSGKQEQRLARYVNERDRRVITTFMMLYKSEETLIPFYQDTLVQRIENVYRTAAFIDATKEAISECLGISKSHLIIHTIIDHLNFGLKCP